MIFFDDLRDIVDDAVQTTNVGHVYKGSWHHHKEKGRDICLEFFGEETEKCREYNRKFT